MSHSGNERNASDRSVWIVGDPEEGAANCYHRRDCYVLYQVGNRGREREFALGALPEKYVPCQICVPGGRSSTVASGEPALGKAQRSTGVQPGHLVDVEDLDTGEVSGYRIASPDRPPGSGTISPGSPLGAALVGKAAGAVVEFTPPKGGSRKLRILRFEPGSD